MIPQCVVMSPKLTPSPMENPKIKLDVQKWSNKSKRNKGHLTKRLRKSQSRTLKCFTPIAKISKRMLSVSLRTNCDIYASMFQHKLNFKFLEDPTSCNTFDHLSSPIKALSQIKMLPDKSIMKFGRNSSTTINSETKIIDFETTNSNSIAAINPILNFGDLILSYHNFKPFHNAYYYININNTESDSGEGFYERNLTRRTLLSYTVYYFLVEYDDNKHDDSSKQSDVEPSHSRPESPCPATSGSTRYSYCPSTCPIKKKAEDVLCSKNTCYQDGSKAPPGVVCKSRKCPSTAYSESVVSLDDSEIEIRLADIKNPCGVKSCDVSDMIKDVIVDGYNKDQRRKASNVDGEYDAEKCYCDCDCNFQGGDTKTTYCGVCGGYERLGRDVTENLPDYAKPHPCPVFHKLYDKKRMPTVSPWPEEKSEQDTKSPTGKSNQPVATPIFDAESMSPPYKQDKEKKKKETKQVLKTVKKKKEKKQETDDASLNVQEEPKKKPTKQKKVPKNMGWLWTSESVPGMKFRPKWKPGCAHKRLVRQYRRVQIGADALAKKKRERELHKKKKLDPKPLLIITKKEGEYTVQMEVIKKYSKERFLNQYPYEDKPPLMYTIGKTEETKRKIKKHQERKERRETRAKRRFLQSTFRDKCQEICVKAYNQAIGVLPMPNPNDPECPCGTSTPAITPSLDSCSCSESGSMSASDTDGDEWVIEFSPPLVRWDGTAKPPPVLSENSSQYTYLDYKVELYDKQGNPVPRFFTGPDGKQQCSDLGGFWDHNHKWLQINKDGYIAPDGRWVPNRFIGPDGCAYTSDDGGFQDLEGRFWRVGIDGYVDKDGKWVWYPRRSGGGKSVTSVGIGAQTGAAKKTDKKADSKNPSAPGAGTKQVKIDGKPGAAGTGILAIKGGTANAGAAKGAPPKGTSVKMAPLTVGYMANPTQTPLRYTPSEQKANRRFDQPKFCSKNPSSIGGSALEKCPKHDMLDMPLDNYSLTRDIYGSIYGTDSATGMKGGTQNTASFYHLGKTPTVMSASTNYGRRCMYGRSLRTVHQFKQRSKYMDIMELNEEEHHPITVTRACNTTASNQPLKPNYSSQKPLYGAKAYDVDNANSPSSSLNRTRCQNRPY